MTDNLDVEAVEEWRDVPGFPGYQASSLGRVRRTFDYERNRPHIRMLSDGSNQKDRYCTIHVYVGGLKKKIGRHILVAAAFHGQKPEGLVTNHIDGDKRNNRPENLEYITVAANNMHASILGLAHRGSLNPKAKLNEASVIEICRLLHSGLPRRKIAQRFGVSKDTVDQINNGKAWRHVERPRFS